MTHFSRSSNYHKGSCKQFPKFNRVFFELVTVVRHYHYIISTSIIMALLSLSVFNVR